MYILALSRSAHAETRSRTVPILAWCAVGLLITAGIRDSVRSAAACPFCSAVSQTFGEEIESLEAAVLTRMVSPPEEPADDAYGELPMATFEVTEILKGDEYVKVGREIKTHYFGKKRDASFLIMGTNSPEIVWASPLPMSARGIDYIKSIVTLPKGPERLKFFLKFLEDEDEMLARDAYDEFAKAPYDHIVELKDAFDREQVVAWVRDTEQVPASRRSLYITMLGICGTAEDVTLLESYMRSNKREERMGLNAIIACYLTLRGEDGMGTVKELFLANKDAEYADTYAAITALRFHGSETEVLSSDCVLDGFRSMLDRPELADLVIPDLARSEDWSVLPRMLKLFKDADDESNWVRVPIVNYVRACPLPESEAMMAELKTIDPEAVKRASMFMPFAPKKAADGVDDATEAAATEVGDLPPLPVPPPEVEAADINNAGPAISSAGESLPATSNVSDRRPDSGKKPKGIPPLVWAAMVVLAVAIFGAVVRLGKR